MVREKYLCTDCVQAITNPICPRCFSRQVISWLRDKKISNYRMNNIIEVFNLLTLHAEENPSDISCILCGSKTVNLCIYCFTNKAFRIIKTHTNNVTLREFNEDFSTKIWRIQ